MEREGISLTHPAKFIMIGSGNPEEGELRPQLLDRFGMAVNIRTIFDMDQRIELVMNKLAYESDPKGYIEECKEETEALKAKIVAAQKLLPSVKMDRDLALKISGAQRRWSTPTVCGRHRRDARGQGACRFRRTG